MDSMGQEREEMTVVEVLAGTAEANDRAASLVANGIGAEVRPGNQGFEVVVLAGEVVRARQILGIEEPEEPADEEELARSSRGLLVRVLLVAAVFVILPLAAFWITFKVSGG